MSPIGRVFIVLNLLLAGAFLGFAGTYLQDQDNWKTKHDDLEASTKAQIAELTGDNRNLQDTLIERDRQVVALDQEKGGLATQLATKNTEIERQEKQLSELSNNLQVLTANSNAWSDKMEATANQAQQAYDDSIAAQTARDDAIRARDTATGQVNSLTNQVGELESQIIAKDAQIGDLTRENNNLNVYLEIAIANGFGPAMAVPSLNGTVTEASGVLVTISVTDNPAGAEIKPGFMFAIYSDTDGYKGEMRVTDVRDNFVFGKMWLPQPGKPVQVGDKASTQTN